MDLQELLQGLSFVKPTPKLNFLLKFPNQPKTLTDGWLDGTMDEAAQTMLLGRLFKE